MTNPARVVSTSEYASCGCSFCPDWSDDEYCLPVLPGLLASWITESVTFSPDGSRLAEVQQLYLPALDTTTGPLRLGASRVIVRDLTTS